MWNKKYSVGVDLSVLLRSMLPFEKVEVDVVDLDSLEVKGDSGPPGGGTLGESVEGVHKIQKLLLFQMIEDNCRCANSYYANKPQLKLQSQTTNQATFKSYPIPQRQDLPPPQIVQKRYDPDVLQSSYNSSFIKPRPVKDSYQDQVDVLSRHYQNKPKNVPFHSDTSYKQSFPRHEVKVEKQPAFEYKPNKNKFEGESSYKSTFVQKKNNDFNKSQEIATLSDYMGRKAKVTFQGQSSYKDTFKNPGVKPEKQPEFKYQPKRTKFEGESSYKSTFKAMPREAYGSGTEYCPVHPGKVAIK